MHKSTKILLTVFLTLGLAIGGVFMLYHNSPLPEVRGNYIPHQKQKIAYNAPLKIEFSNKMNQKITESAIKISPQITGEFQWENEYTLLFKPKKKLEIDQNINLSISKSAQDYLGKNLVDDFEIDFIVVGAPQVIFVSPINEVELAEIKGEEIDEEMDRTPVLLPYSPSLHSEYQEMPKITIMFDRPIRELTTLDESDEKQKIDFLKIEPEIEGNYKWLGTSAIQFIPNKLPMSTTFEVRIPKGTKALDAGFTEKEYVWHFETEAPKLLASVPENNEQLFDPKEEIKLHFNQQVNLDTLYQGLNFYPPEDGFFNGEITFEKDDLTTVIVKPSPKLIHPENYTLSVQKGIRGFDGTKESEEEVLIKFKTYDLAKIKNHTPKDKATNTKQREISIEFTTPMVEEFIEERLTITPEVSNLNIYLSKRDTKAVIRGDFQPGVKYEVFLKKGSKDTFDQLIREDLKYEFTIADANPYFTILARGDKGLFSEKIPPEYYLRSINLKDVDIELCKIDEATFLSNEKNYNWYKYNCENPEKWSLELAHTKNTYYTTPLPLEEKTQEKGIYFLSLSSQEYLKNWGDNSPYKYNQVFFITDTSLSLKYTDHESLLWATDMTTGEPIEKMQIQIKDLESGNLIKQGQTNQDGIFQTKVEEKNRFYVFAEKDEKWGIVGSNWSNGINRWDFGLQSGWYEDERSFGYLYTDRPIYRPDHEVYFKGIVRKENDVNFSLPEMEEIDVSIEDSFGKKVFDEKLEINQNGSFNGKFKLAKDAPVGRYYMFARYKKGYFNRVFHVEEYRKPEFKLEITSEKTDFINKEHLSAKIQGSYYFGGTLSDVPVNWTISSDNYFFDQYEGEWYNFSADDNNYWKCGWWNNCAIGQDVVDSGQGELDQNGKFEINLPINLDEKKMSQLYTLSATVHGLNNQQVTNRETFIIHKGEYYLGIKNDDYVTKTEDKTKFKIITVDHQGKPLKDKLVSVDFYKREWNSIKKEGIDGSFYWENEHKDTLISSEKDTTDRNGKTTVTFTPKEGGYYIAKAKSIDSKGNEIIAQGSVYASSSRYIGWGVSNHDRIDLVLDKSDYKIGDTANILVKSPFEESVKALFTVERQGIITSKILTLKNNSEIIKLPITEEMLPNVYVSVLLFKGSGETYKVIQAQKSINALNSKVEKNEAEKKELEKKILELKKEIEDLENIEPSEDGKKTSMVRLKIRQNTLSKAEQDLEKSEQAYIQLLAERKAKNTEVEEIKKQLDLNTLAKIEAEQFSEFPRPEFKLGYANILVDTESKRLNLEIKTDKERYHAGEEVTLNLKTTNQEGEGLPAEVSIAVVDESILALKSRNLEDLVDYFYAKRGLKIKNAQSLVYFIERLNVKAQKGEKGGGGGPEDSLLIKKRGEFKDTAVWEPNIQTDESGEAKITFTLPDNLTTWQILAIGATNQTIVGSAEKDFITTKDLIIRPILPRFLVMNDTLQIGAIVHNNTGELENVKISLAGENFETLNDSIQKVSIKDREGSKVLWKIKVNQEIKDNFFAEFNLKAETSLYSDEVSIKLPVKSFSVPEVVSTSGMTKDLAREKIYLPKNIDSTMGEVKISLTSTLATNLKDGLEFLAQFPYGCAEQTMSRHLPNVILKQTDNLFAGNNNSIFAEDSEIDLMVSEGLQKLYQLQRHDGGWGYWAQSDYSYPYLSAYVLFGLNETQKAGYQVDEKVFAKGELYLKQYLRNPQKFNRDKGLSLDDQAFALWVLTQLDKGELSLSLKLADDYKQLSQYAKGYMLMNFMELSRTEKSPAIQKIIQQKIGLLKSDIEASAIIDTRGVHFEEVNQNYWSMNSNTRTTAILLKTLVENDVENPLIPKMIEWLRTQKKDGKWSNTQETVWSLIAFTEYFQKTSELEANYNVKVNLNGKEKVKHNFNSSNLFTREELIAEVKDLRVGMPANEILFNKEGEGNLYYDVTAKYYLPLEEIPERSEGINLIRQYSDLEDPVNKEVETPVVGDILKGKLTIIAPEDRHFVLVEEFLPAGFESINFNLETEDQNLKSEINQERDKNYWWQNNTWRFYHREFRDDRISLFADYLPAGIYNFEFLVRVTSAGEFHHLPAQAYEMYFPENFGRTNGRIIKIVEE